MFHYPTLVWQTFLPPLPLRVMLEPGCVRHRARTVKFHTEFFEQILKVNLLVVDLTLPVSEKLHEEAKILQKDWETKKDMHKRVGGNISPGRAAPAVEQTI
jgi:hypothetical protein